MLRVLVLLLVPALSVLALPEPEAALSDVARLRREAAGGKCTTSAECVAPNVCSKWGWCQWTSIYGQDGPSQGAAAPDGGRSGQCVTSADCASRVPFCSKLGFCHGGRLPFDEAQLDVPDDDAVKDTQGYINNDPVNNSPVFKNANANGQKADKQPE